MEKELKNKLNKEWNLLDKPKYKPHCIHQNVKDKVEDFQAVFERAKYGVAAQDVWSLDSYLLHVIYNGLKILRHEQNGHPWKLTEEQWNNELDYAIALTECAMLDPFDLDMPWYLKYQEAVDKNESLEEIEKASNDWSIMQKFFAEEQQRSLNDLMDWLKIYIWDLWW